MSDSGVLFPLVDGSRSTTATGRAVFADAARAVDPGLARAIEQERDWRRGYVEHARRLLEVRLATAEASLAVPVAGLASLHRRFVFARDGEELALAEALASPQAAPLHSVEIRGEREQPVRELSVPYRGERLRGDALHRQLDRWEATGIVEPSFCEAIRVVDANPEWLAIPGQTVLLLGAGAEMGPLRSLCEWGAHVAPLDLASRDLWERVLGTVRRGAGTATVPVPADAAGALGIAPAAFDPDLDDLAAAAGVDLIAETPEVAAWAEALEGPLVVGNYVYADGATNVRVAMAVDALTTHLASRRADVSLAVLATPTDVFAVPEDAVTASQEAYRARGRGLGRISGVVRGASGGRLLAPNYTDLTTTEEGVRFGVVDCLVPQQGPNYALAKRLQRWRASVARADGMVASINVAPPTRTRSVLKNRVLAAAYAGARRFGIEVFDPSTSNTLMAAMLVHDLCNPASSANPATPLRHPLELFSDGANHGGLWRNPYAARSVLGLAVVLGIVPRGA